MNKALVVAMALVGLLGLSAYAKGAAVPAVSVQEGKIENKTDVPKANFRPLIDMIKHELFEAGFAVVDEKDMVGALKEAEKASVMDGMEGDAPASGNLKVPGYFVRMSILQYGFTASAQRNVVSGNVNKLQTAQVRIAFTITDARTARLVASANTKSAPIAVRTVQGADVSQIGNFQEQALQEASQDCCRQLVAALMKKTPPQFRPEGAVGKVLKVADYGVLVKIKPDRVKVGEVLDIFKTEALDDDDDDDKKTNDDGDDDDEEIVEEIYIGSATVTELKKKYVVCSPVTANAKFEKGQLARPSTRYRAANHAGANEPKPAPAAAPATSADDPF